MANTNDKNTDHIEVPVDYLKKKYLELRAMTANEFRKRVRKDLGWTRTVWFNKLHGITPLTNAEFIVLESIFPKYRD